MISEAICKIPENPEDVFLMPPESGNYAIDKTIYAILDTLRTQGWKSQGLETDITEIKIDNQRAKFNRAGRITGDSFEILLYRGKDLSTLDAPCASMIRIPGHLLYLPAPNDRFGPTLYVHEDNEFLRQRWKHTPELIANKGCVRYENRTYPVDGTPESKMIPSEYFENKSRDDLGEYREGIGELVPVENVLNKFDAWLTENILKPLLCIT
jgi:hypothetical protein